MKLLINYVDVYISYVYLDKCIYHNSHTPNTLEGLSLVSASKMDKWKGKVAIVTGASCGIGAAIAKALVKEGMNVVGLARRKERIDELAKELDGEEGKLYSFRADFTKEEDILNAFKFTNDHIGPVSVLVNNAGIFQKSSLHDGETDKWKKVLDTNVLGVAIASREAVTIMRENNIDGYIININSVAGHIVIDMPSMNVYSASKHAVTAMTETLRFELARLKSNIRVTSLSPGGVNTEIALTNDFLPKEIYDKMMESKTLELLESEDVADAVLYLLSTPLRVQVTELTIRPIRETNKMPEV